MSIIEWVAVGILGFLFLIILLYTWQDLWRDRRLYLVRSKNVRQFKKPKKVKNRGKS